MAERAARGRASAVAEVGEASDSRAVSGFFERLAAAHVAKAKRLGRSPDEGRMDVSVPKHQ